MTEQTDAAEADYAAFWWAQQSGETETWEQLDTEEREAVMENCYAETVADYIAAREAAARAEALRGILFRVETACDGYSHLMDEDVPSNVTDLAAYEQGAHDAAEAIRAIARTDGAGS